MFQHATSKGFDIAGMIVVMIDQPQLRNPSPAFEFIEHFVETGGVGGGAISVSYTHLDVYKRQMFVAVIFIRKEK